MKAIILAAGRGSRLHPYTADCPKCLTEIGGMTLIDRQLKTLRNAGINDIVIVSGYLSKMLRLEGTQQVINIDWETTNMVESLFAAEDFFSDDIIVSYSDIVYEPKVIHALINCQADISVIVDRKWRAYWEHRFEDPLSDAQSLKFDKTGAIIDIGQKVDDIDTIKAQYIGLMRFQGSGVEVLKNTHRDLGKTSRPWMQKHPIKQAYLTDLLMEIILSGGNVQSVPIDNGWLEIDTTKDFEVANEMFKDGSINKFFDPDSN